MHSQKLAMCKGFKHAFLCNCMLAFGNLKSCMQLLRASTSEALRTLMAIAGEDDPSSLASKGVSHKLQHGIGSALADLKTLAKHPVYVLNVAGTAVYTGDLQNTLTMMCVVCSRQTIVMITTPHGLCCALNVAGTAVHIGDQQNHNMCQIHLAQQCDGLENAVTVYCAACGRCAFFQVIH